MTGYNIGKVCKSMVEMFNIVEMWASFIPRSHTLSHLGTRKKQQADEKAMYCYIFNRKTFKSQNYVLIEFIYLLRVSVSVRASERAMSAFSKLPITMRGIYYTVSRLKLCTICNAFCRSLCSVTSTLVVKDKIGCESEWERAKMSSIFNGTASQFSFWMCV